VSTKPVIDVEFVRAVLGEFGIRDNTLQAINSGDCRLECRIDKAAAYAARIACTGFEMLSNNRQDSSTAVLWFRVRGMTV
jgi:hypothetical protein